MAKITNQVCLTHTDRAASTRCETCFRPLCQECAQEQQGHVFCSQECAHNYSASGERLANLEEKSRKARKQRFIRRLVVLAVLAAVGYGVYRSCVQNRERRARLERKFRQVTSSLRKYLPR